MQECASAMQTLGSSWTLVRTGFPRSSNSCLKNQSHDEGFPVGGGGGGGRGFGGHFGI